MIIEQTIRPLKTKIVHRSLLRISQYVRSNPSLLVNPIILWRWRPEGYGAPAQVELALCNREAAG